MDLHGHTPASFHWQGAKFDADLNSASNRSLVDEMIAAINAAEPAVFVLMDYWTFDGWFALKHRLKEPGAPQLHEGLSGNRTAPHGAHEDTKRTPQRARSVFR